MKKVGIVSKFQLPSADVWITCSVSNTTGSNKNVVISVTSKENFTLFSVLLHLDLKAKFCEVVVYFFSVYFYLYFFHNGVSCTIPLCWKYLLKIEGKNIKSESQ